MWQNRRVSTPMPLPTDLAEAHALILRQREELAAAAARASGAEALIAHMKLVIAKLRREQYGQSSERGRKVLDQLELQLEELEAETSENAVAAEDKGVKLSMQARKPRPPRSRARRLFAGEVLPLYAADIDRALNQPWAPSTAWLRSRRSTGA